MRFVARQTEDLVGSSAVLSRYGIGSEVISCPRYDEWHSIHREADTRPVSPVHRISLRRAMLVYRLPDAAF